MPPGVSSAAPSESATVKTFRLRLKACAHAELQQHPETTQLGGVGLDVRIDEKGNVASVKVRCTTASKAFTACVKKSVEGLTFEGGPTTIKLGDC